MVPFPTEVCPREATHHCPRGGDWRCLSLHGTEEIRPALEGISIGLGEAGYSNRETFGVHLALEEALINAIKHGHQGDRAKEVRLRYRLTPECILAEIEDQGPGFQLYEVPDPLAPENLGRASGRGLLLMRNYMTWVRFNTKGNHVTMCRLRGGE